MGSTVQGSGKYCGMATALLSHKKTCLPWSADLISSFLNSISKAWWNTLTDGLKLPFFQDLVPQEQKGGGREDTSIYLSLFAAKANKGCAASGFNIGPGISVPMPNHGRMKNTSWNEMLFAWMDLHE